MINILGQEEPKPNCGKGLLTNLLKKLEADGRYSWQLSKFRFRACFKLRNCLYNLWGEGGSEPKLVKGTLGIMH